MKRHFKLLGGYVRRNAVFFAFVVALFFDVFIAIGLLISAFYFKLTDIEYLLGKGARANRHQHRNAVVTDLKEKQHEFRS